MKINTNIQALNAYRNLTQNQFGTSKNLEKLSSGLRINRAADDAAGLAISEKMRSQIRGLKQAERNSMDGISLLQTSEGAMQEVHAILQRMRELSVQAANDTNTEYDREQIQKEIEQLKLEIDSISEKTEFNTRKLLNGSSAVLTSITREADNAAGIVGLPKVMDARLQSDKYHLKVEDTKEVVTITQPNAGVTQAVDVKLDPDSSFFPQAFGEYTINVRNYNINNETEHNALVQVIGPNGLPLEELSVPVNTSATGPHQRVSIGGLEIDASKINGAGTVKVAIEQQAEFSVYRGGETTDEGKLISAAKTLTSKNGIIRHGGIEFEINNRINSSVATGQYSIPVTSLPADGQTIMIDGKSFTKVDEGAGAGEFVNADGLLALLQADEDLSAKYTITLDTDSNPDVFKFEQNPGYETHVPPNVLNHSGNPIAVTEIAAGEGNTSKFNITNNALAFQIGPNTNQNVMIDVPRLDIVTLGIENVDVTSHESANDAIFQLDKAIEVISDIRAKLGATQNRMEHTINNLQVTHENLTASESRIRDADMALEMTEFTRNNIINQAATAMLAQANQLPQGVLQLLQ